MELTSTPKVMALCSSASQPGTHAPVQRWAAQRTVRCNRLSAGIHDFGEEPKLVCTRRYGGVGQKVRNERGRYVAEFAWLQFVQPASIDAALATKNLRRQLIECAPDLPQKTGVAVQFACQKARRVQRQVHVRHRGTGTIEDEAKGSTALGVATAEIGADDRRGRAVFLTVPERTVFAEISLPQALGLSLFEVAGEGREASLNFFFGELRVEEEESAVDVRRAVFSGRDFVVL